MKLIKYIPFFIMLILLNIACNNKHASLVNTDIKIALQHSIICFKLPIIIKYSTHPVYSDYNDDIDYEHNYQFITSNDTGKMGFRYLFKGTIDYKYENDTSIFNNMEENMRRFDTRYKDFVRIKKSISGQ